MIIYKGKGIFVLFAAILGLLAGVLANHKLSPGWMAILMFGVATVVNLLLTKFFVRDDARKLYDEKTGKRVVIHNNASFFFIPNRFWTFIFLVAGILLSLLAFRGAFD